MNTTAHLNIFLADAGTGPGEFDTHLVDRPLGDVGAAVTLPYVWPAPRVSIHGSAAELRGLAAELLDAADKIDAEEARRAEALQRIADGRDRCERCQVTRDFCTAIHVNTGKRCCVSCHHVPESVPAANQEVPAA